MPCIRDLKNSVNFKAISKRPSNFQLVMKKMLKIAQKQSLEKLLNKKTVEKPASHIYNCHVIATIAMHH